MHAALVAATIWATAVSAQDWAETGRDGDGYCTFATCTESGATVSWSHGEGALVRGCLDTPQVTRFLVRLRTTKQDDPSHTEQVYIDLEDNDRYGLRCSLPRLPSPRS
jgi:hypothetical protein